MRKPTLVAITATATLLLTLLLLPSGQAISDSIRSVLVTNFPDVQSVQGEVSVRGPLRVAKQVSFREVLVPPVRADDTTRLVDAGVVETAGFPNLVLSLHGLVKGSVHQPGEVGAVLVPDEPTVREAFDELGLIHFPLRVEAKGVSSRTPYFASNQPRHIIGFSRYRLFLYNTTDKTVTASVFAYLTH